MKEKIIVTLTTSPKRIFQIDQTILSIKNQTSLPNKIVLNLPDTFSRTKTQYKIPNWIIEDEMITVNRCGIDNGPVTKLLPTLSLYSNPNDILISIDDDIIYPQTMIEELVNILKSNPEHVICASGIIIGDDLSIRGIKTHMKNVQLIEGFAGVAYRRKFFRDDFEEYINRVNKCFDCFVADDVTISNYLAKYNIQKKIISTKKHNKRILKILDFGLLVDALHKGGNGTINSEQENIVSRYEKAFIYLKETNEFYFDEKLSFDHKCLSHQRKKNLFRRMNELAIY